MSARSVFRSHAVPFLLQSAALFASAVAGDMALHAADLAWVGRYLGIPGLALIAVSFLYSARKRRMFGTGSAGGWLSFHEAAAWTGSLLTLVHSGAHFNALLPWMATVAMGTSVLSGIVGARVLAEARARRASRRKALAGDPSAETGLAMDDLTVGAMETWRSVHIPICVAFAALAAGHLLQVFLFWGWS